MTKTFLTFMLIAILGTSSGSLKGSPDENNRNYHLIYLDISHSKDRRDLTVKLIGLLDDITKKDDDFLLYLSNGYRPEVIYSRGSQKHQTDKVISLLQTLNTSPPILRFDKDSILNIWSKNDVVVYTKDGKVNTNFRNIYFHYFISSDLFKLDEDELIDRFLLIKDLTKKYIDPQKIIIELIYNRDDSGPFTDRKNQLSKINKTGYRYIFTSY